MLGLTESSTDKLGYGWAREGLGGVFARFKIKKRLLTVEIEGYKLNYGDDSCE